MKTNLLKTVFLFLPIFILLILNSCRTDEFNFSDIKIKDDWAMQVVVPLLSGDFEFVDLVYDWSEPLPPVADNTTIFALSQDSVLTLPTNEIYRPSIIIDSLVFLINGDDYLQNGTLKYIVENGAPLPLNFQMYFYNSHNSLQKGPAFLPPPFNAANNGKPAKSEFTLEMTAEQLYSFKQSNRIEISTWFENDKPMVAKNYNGLLPVHISVVFNGTVKNDYKQ